MLRDALDASHKSKETFVEDIHEAFKQLPRRRRIDAACQIGDQGNEAVKSSATISCNHYTSVLAAYRRTTKATRERAVLPPPRRPAARAPRRGAVRQPQAVRVGSLSYRLGCALEAAKRTRSAPPPSQSQRPPDNVPGDQRFKARNILQMVMDTERVNDPHWMRSRRRPRRRSRSASSRRRTRTWRRCRRCARSSASAPSTSAAARRALQRRQVARRLGDGQGPQRPPHRQLGRARRACPVGALLDAPRTDAYFARRRARAACRASCPPAPRARWRRARRWGCCRSSRSAPAPCRCTPSSRTPSSRARACAGAAPRPRRIREHALE